MCRCYGAQLPRAAGKYFNGVAIPAANDRAWKQVLC